MTHPMHPHSQPHSASKANRLKDSVLQSLWANGIGQEDIVLDNYRKTQTSTHNSYIAWLKEWSIFEVRKTKNHESSPGECGLPSTTSLIESPPLVINRHLCKLYLHLIKYSSKDFVLCTTIP